MNASDQAKLATLEREHELRRQTSELAPELRHYIERQYRNRFVMPVIGFLVISMASYVLWGHF